MSLLERTQALRQQLHHWAKEPDWQLLERYELLSPWYSPFGLQRRLLRALGLGRNRYCKQIWHSGLKHAPVQQGKTLLLWGDITQKQPMRAACHAVQERLAVANTGPFIPVLVTNVADFAFYSRLGWLVEYLPDLPGQGEAYRQRKQQYLAWRYRDAVVLPLSAGLADTAEWRELFANLELG